MPRVGHNPLFLGFDDIEQMLERLGKASADGYPPYNIECVRDENGQVARFRLVLAVAGFTRDQLEITLEDNELLIRGVQRPETQRDYLYRGIAARRFQRSFVLGEGLKVHSAELDDGLLTIELTRPTSIRRIKKIEIKDQS
jgi:HSP20 family molecular chaperone IbpA